MTEMSTQTVQEVQTAGAVLWTVSQGAGLPVVLCHGGPGLSDNLEPLAFMIDDLARVHRYDQRGSGRSRGAGGFDVDTFIADLDALRTHWGHPKWVLGGHSWGANLALFYALAHPEHTLAVIYLAGTGLRWGWQQDAQQRRLARLSDTERAELADLQRELAAGDTADIQRFLQLMWITDFADRLHARVLDEQPLYRFPRDEHIFRAVTETYKTHLKRGLENQVRLLDVPVLVIHGAHDTDPARARRVAQLAPRGRWVELEHSAHCPWLEEPAAVRDALRRFLHDLS